jgi:hypothetical protein
MERPRSASDLYRVYKISKNPLEELIRTWQSLEQQILVTEVQQIYNVSCHQADVTLHRHQPSRCNVKLYIGIPAEDLKSTHPVT